MTIFSYIMEKNPAKMLDLMHTVPASSQLTSPKLRQTISEEDIVNRYTHFIEHYTKLHQQSLVQFKPSQFQSPLLPTQINMSSNKNSSSRSTSQGGGGGGNRQSSKQDPGGSSGHVKSGTASTTGSTTDEELIFEMDDINTSQGSSSDTIRQQLEWQIIFTSKTSKKD